MSIPLKLAYALGGIALNVANLTISQWLLKLYVPNRTAALVSSGLFVTAFFIGRLLDGVMDPLVGYWSDNSRFRWGRRLPFIAAALVPVALVSLFIWTPPFGPEAPLINGIYVFVMIQLFFIFWTILANPYMALLPELTPDIAERINISTMQAFFLMVGIILFSLSGPLIEVYGYTGLGVAVGGITIISFLPTLLFIRENPERRKTRFESRTPARMFTRLSTTFRNRPFRYLLAATGLFWFSLNVVTLMVPFWTEHALGRSEGDVFLVMAPFIGANIIFFFIFNVFSKKAGKYPAFLVTLLGSAAAMFLFVSQGTALWGGISPLLQAQISMAVIGAFVSGFLMLPMALLADVIDHDAEYSGEWREGQYYGMQSIFQKTAIGLSIAAGSVLMYVGGAGEEPTVTGLRLLVAAAGAAALVAALLFMRYPLRDRAEKSQNVSAVG